MKITFLTGEYPPMQGGIADHTACLANHLAPLGIQASILTSRRWQKTTPASPNLLISQSPNLPPIYPYIPNWGWRCWPAITRFLNQHQPDILHIQYQAAAFDLGGWVNWLPWYLKKRRFKTRLVVTFHDLRIPYLFPKAGPLRWRSILALARYSDAIICTDRQNQLTIRHELPYRGLAQLTNSQSPISGPMMNDEYGTMNNASFIIHHSSLIIHSLFSILHPPSSNPTPLLKMIPLGSNVEPQPPANFDRAAWRAKYRVQNKTFLLAYFGFLNQSKGGEELIEALALLRRQGLDVQLLLIGGEIGHADPNNVAYARRVQSLIQDHALAAFVHRTGYVELPEVSAHLLAADAVVMPYRDGVSFRRTTLIAALQHGCPIISTMPADLALVPEIQPGQNMLLAPPHNAPALAQTITQLIGNRPLQEQLSQGAKTLGTLFEWPTIAAETRELYQAIIDAASTQPEQT